MPSSVSVQLQPSAVAFLGLLFPALGLLAGHRFPGFVAAAQMGSAVLWFAVASRQIKRVSDIGIRSESRSVLASMALLLPLLAGMECASKVLPLPAPLVGHAPLDGSDHLF